MIAGNKKRWCVMGLFPEVKCPGCGAIDSYLDNSQGTPVCQECGLVDKAAAAAEKAAAPAKQETWRDRPPLL